MSVTTPTAPLPTAVGRRGTSDKEMEASPAECPPQFSERRSAPKEPPTPHTHLINDDLTYALNISMFALWAAHPSLLKPK